jgi:hypothetical protein
VYLACIFSKCLSQKIILKLYSKTTYNSVFIDMKIIEIGVN